MSADSASRYVAMAMRPTVYFISHSPGGSSLSPVSHQLTHHAAELQVEWRYRPLHPGGQIAPALPRPYLPASTGAADLKRPVQVSEALKPT